MFPTWANDGARAQFNARRFAPVNRIWRLTGMETAVNDATTSTPVLFRFPRSVLVTGILMFTTAATVAELAQFEIAVDDHHDEQIVTDGRVGRFAPALALHGAAFEWCPLDIDVKGGWQWKFSFKNTRTGISHMTPRVLLRVEEHQP